MSQCQKIILWLKVCMWNFWTGWCPRRVTSLFNQWANLKPQSLWVILIFIEILVIYLCVSNIINLYLLPKYEYDCVLWICTYVCKSHSYQNTYLIIFEWHHFHYYVKSMLWYLTAIYTTDSPVSPLNVHSHASHHTLYLKPNRMNQEAAHRVSK